MTAAIAVEEIVRITVLKKSMTSFPLTMPSQNVRKVAHGEGSSTGSARDYLDALDTIAAMKRSFEAFFERFDFLLTPTTAAMPWPARDSHPSVIDGKPVGARGHAVFTPFASALGPPAISMPCRVEPSNLPVGMQIGAASNRDLPLLAFARAYEVRLFDHHWPT